jgi:hypothetical protein
MKRAKQLLIVGIFGLICGFTAVTAWYISHNAAYTNTKASTQGTLTYQPTFSYSCLESKGCTTKLDTDPSKNSCYASCRRTITPEIIDTSYFAQKELSYIREFLRYYSATNYGQLRRRAVENIANFNTNYYRMVCEVMASSAIVGYVDRQPDMYFAAIADRLTAVFDDYDNNYPVGNALRLGDPRQAWGNPGNSGFWGAGIPGYECGFAASMVWNKFPNNTAWDQASGHAGRTALQKRAKIKANLLDLATKNASVYNAASMAALNAQTISSGNSQGEESMWNAAYYAFVSQFLPVSGARYGPMATALAKFATTHCIDVTKCALDEHFLLENHGIKPHPQYGYALLTGSASLPHLLFNGFERDGVPIELRLGGNSAYDATNIFESNLRYINLQTFNLRGSYSQRGVPGTKQFEQAIYLGRSGVSDWGTAGDFNVTPFALQYFLDKYNWSGYRNKDAPYYYLTLAEDARLAQGKLYLPPVFENGNWINKPLDAARYADVWAPLDPAHPNSTTDEKINTHFFLNAVKAFTHVISYIYMAKPVGYFSKLE